MAFVETFREVRQQKPLTLRGRMRNIALSGLAFKNRILGQEQQYLKKPRVQFLYIHHLFRDEQANFRKLLKKLSEEHRFLSYSEAVERVLQRNIDRPYIAFSSDDGFKNNLEAASILEEFEASACFFINPNSIGLNQSNKAEAFCREQLHFPPTEFLSWQEVNQLQARGHEIGSHTMNHINVAATHPEAIAEDMASTYQILKEKCGEIKHFAFPYGRFFHFKPEAAPLVFEAGFSTIASAERGCHINHDQPLSSQQLLIRRDHTVLAWPMEHILYFLANNAAAASPQNNLFPY